MITAGTRDSDKKDFPLILQQKTFLTKSFQVLVYFASDYSNLCVWCWPCSNLAHRYTDKSSKLYIKMVTRLFETGASSVLALISVFSGPCTGNHTRTSFTHFAVIVIVSPIYHQVTFTNTGFSSNFYLKLRMSNNLHWHLRCFCCFPLQSCNSGMYSIQYIHVSWLFPLVLLGSVGKSIKVIQTITTKLNQWHYGNAHFSSGKRMRIFINLQKPYLGWMELFYCVVKHNVDVHVTVLLRRFIHPAAR